MCMSMPPRMQWNKRPRFQHAESGHWFPTAGRWMLVGLVLGSTMQVALSRNREPAASTSVVVLRSTRYVTIEREDASLADILAELKRQTGYAFEMEPDLTKSKATYDILLKDVPLQDVLSPIGYLLHATWDRHGQTFRLRSMTPEEEGSDALRYSMAIDRVCDYLADVDPNDPKLKPGFGDSLLPLRDALGHRERMRQLASDPTRPWMIQITHQTLGISFSETIHNGNAISGSTASSGWAW